MTDTVTISRECAERAVRAPKTGNWSALGEIAAALASPATPSDTVMISRACLQHVADALDRCKAEVDEALEFPSAPPPLSGMREALEKLKGQLLQLSRSDDLFSERREQIKQMAIDLHKLLASPDVQPSTGLREALIAVLDARENWEATTDPAFEAARYQFFRTKCTEARRLLASPDDGWVKVDEEHPLPGDLKAGDEVRITKGNDNETERNELFWITTCRPRDTIAYRRRSSAEQGG